MRPSESRRRSIWGSPTIGRRAARLSSPRPKAGWKSKRWGGASRARSCVYRIFHRVDATLAEINPLVITKDQRLLALDGKMVIDDNALFRHPDIADMRDSDEEAPAEREARKYGLSYVRLVGNIGW